LRYSFDEISGLDTDLLPERVRETEVTDLSLF